MRDLADRPPLQLDAPDAGPGLSAARLLTLGLVPGGDRHGAMTLGALDPATMTRHLPEIRDAYGDVRIESLDVSTHQSRSRARLAVPLALGAERFRPETRSCRSVPLRALGQGLLAATALALAGLVAWPSTGLTALIALALLVSALATGVKLASLVATLVESRHGSAPHGATRLPDGTRGDGPDDLPVVTLLIALYREGAVLAPLLARLARLDYPRDRLDVLLVTEDDDHETARAIEAVHLPRWVRVLTVPPTPVRTKPRALNYALPFARGSIVGIYDAEDDPDPAQIRAVAAGFARAPEDVVCLQGALDIANDRDSWITRVFALDYAGWFRVVLPGLARLGLVLPLGGTTLFLRRSAIGAIGGWDAHNVTEDADLGLWIARCGGRTALLPITTREEATATTGAWIRQRSRWIKGYAVTCASHLRDMKGMWRDLGSRRLAGVLGLMLIPLAQVTLAPLLWLLWGEAMWPGALPVPDGLVTMAAVIGLGGLAVDLAIAALGAARSGRRGRAAWLPLLLPYQAMATLAAWRAWVQLALAPYHWDKTAHGLGRQSSAPNPVAAFAASSLSRVTNAREMWSRKAA